MFYKVYGSVPQYKSDLLDGVAHGFSTRHGGVGRGDCASMNLAFGRGDDDAIVVKNFEIFAESIGADPRCGVMLGQIHSADILEVTESEFGLGVYNKSEFCLDGYASSTPGALLCVRVADCVPILLADKRTGVIGAVHSGWRGSAKRISARCIEHMCRLGAKREDICAAIGPCICAKCYEVGEDFALACKNELGDEIASRFIERSADGSLHADLKLLNRLVLEEAGISSEHIDVSASCTCCAPNEFFSHRYHKEKRGTMCAMIALRR